MEQSPAYCEEIGAICNYRRACVNRNVKAREAVDEQMAFRDPSSKFAGFFRTLVAGHLFLQDDQFMLLKNELAITDALVALNCNRECIVQEAMGHK
ncbi:MAG: hypothetical protein JWO35_573 [Candidatus Saccharibacteria bacterium]|nr:hypothetical protein [Candidatus Saccharibacteria bacterium]